MLWTRFSTLDSENGDSAGFQRIYSLSHTPNSVPVRFTKKRNGKKAMRVKPIADSARLPAQQPKKSGSARTTYVIIPAPRYETKKEIRLVDKSDMTSAARMQIAKFPT